MEMEFKTMPKAGSADIKDTIANLQEIAASKHPDLLAKMNEISGMLKTYDLLGDKAILEMIIAELGKILQEQLTGSIAVPAAIPPGYSLPKNWETCIGDFVEYLEGVRRLSPASVRIYRAAVKKLLGYREIGEINLHALLEKAYAVLLEYTENEDRDFKWQNRNNISALRVFIDFLQGILRSIQ